MTLLNVIEFDVRYVHGYGKVANVEAGMVFLEDWSGLLHWKIFRGNSGGPWVPRRRVDERRRAMR